MGKRRSKSLIACFAMTLVICAGLLVLNYQSFRTAIQDDRDYVTAALIETGRLTEAQVVEIMSHDITEETLATGRELAEKYGFSDSLTNQQQLIHDFYQKIFWITGVAGIILIGLALWNFRIRQSRELALTELAEEQQEEKELFQLLLQRKSQEDDNIKSSVTDIAHQLKTPVASLKLSMEIALSEDYSPEERQEFKEQTEIQVNKLDLMLDGLVKISQLESDLIQLQPQPYSMKKIIEEIVNSMIMKAIEKDIEIEVELIEDATVLIDRKWTREALGNVLENAIKYSPAHTTITIRLNSLVTYGLIEIIDQGPGIPKEETALIYQRFFRGQLAEASNIEGSGVGLYLTKKIIEEQGGAMMVQPAKPSGSNFQLTLPLAK